MSSDSQVPNRKNSSVTLKRQPITRGKSLHINIDNASMLYLFHNISEYAIF